MDLKCKSNRENQIAVKQLEKNIYRLQDSSKFVSVDAYLVCGTERAIVIDGLEEAQGMYDIVKEITDKPLCMIVTHGHSDHAGRGMREFMDKGCDIYLSSRDLYMVEKLYGKDLKREQLHDLEDGMRFDLGNVSLNVIAMPGHTPGSMILYMEDRKRLFSSDAIGSGSLWMQLKESSSLTEYLKELQRLYEILNNDMDVRIYPGHSAQISSYIEENQDYLDCRYLVELTELTEGIINGKLTGEKKEIPMEEMKGIEIFSVKGNYVADYCYDRNKR